LSREFRHYDVRASIVDTQVSRAAVWLKRASYARIANLTALLRAPPAPLYLP
jgi:hypothetical protein